MVGDGPYPDGEIAETLGTEVLARVPWEPRRPTLLGRSDLARELRLAPLCGPCGRWPAAWLKTEPERYPWQAEAVVGENETNGERSGRCRYGAGCGGAGVRAAMSHRETAASPGVAR